MLPGKSSVRGDGKCREKVKVDPSGSFLGRTLCYVRNEYLTNCLREGVRH